MEGTRSREPPRLGGELGSKLNNTERTSVVVLAFLLLQGNEQEP